GRAFSDAAVQLGLSSYPGFFSPAPPGRAHPYGVFTAGFVPQALPEHEVVLDDGTVVRIDPPPRTAPLEPLAGSPAPPPGDPGPTRRLPLGTLAGARSGDKGGDANIGLWVRDDAAYAWLAALITEAAVRDLLPETADRPLRITRLPNIRAVNIVVEGLLGLGVAYHARFDPQAKGLGEWLRSRHVEIPDRLVRP
ncbi:MAG TPA: exopolyphosphatase, partial [Actinoplanes sp.]|nr:exopolyphosphatase [Actinoplanes sp.]